MIASSESESVAYGGSKKTGPPIQAPESAHDELTPSSSSNKQTSIFSLTFDEIELQSVKTFGSMNMDDFLANLWNVEENQQVPSQLDQTGGGKGIGSQPTPSLERQGSFSIPSPLGKKTVDEVWFEIEKEYPQQGKANNIVDRKPPQRQHTHGEMTLEDFLVKAGVVQESSRRNKPVSSWINGPSLDSNYGMEHVTASSQQKMSAPAQNNNASMDANFGMGHVMGLGFPAHQIVGNNLAIGNGYAAEFSHRNKKRIIDGPPEVVVERRQRRMIKNRESGSKISSKETGIHSEAGIGVESAQTGECKAEATCGENQKRRKEEVLKRKHSTSTKGKANNRRALRRTVSLGW
ncbi:Alpha/beta-hydrolases family protein isoform 1 [Hibiscus syriacus]|uniref:Alpha/beta-hydrolases family protein isoform 1 n=1 Tax=Hibiscus syriacus TaxID=106335 RepID=A0A6A3CYK1_HIBSY|nr:Alpha/beta-hydrolases family protein isoform 1 [Hibiscus syriacus]